jgi:dihydrofolate reductase
MGRKCFDSIVKPLPKRVNIVVTRDLYFAASGVLVAHSIEDALMMAADNGETEAMILGGAQIYDQSMLYWHKLLLTDVDYAPEADVFFTEPNWADFKEVWSESHEPDEKNKYAYTFREFARILPPVSFLPDEA